MTYKGLYAIKPNLQPTNQPNRSLQNKFTYKLFASKLYIYIYIYIYIYNLEVNSLSINDFKSSYLAQIILYAYFYNINRLFADD